VDRGPIGAGLELQPGAATSLAGSVAADCTTRDGPVVAVVASVIRDGEISAVRAMTAPPGVLGAVLDPVCPPVDQALAVRVTGFRYLTGTARTGAAGAAGATGAAGAGDVIVMRLVNHGSQSAQVVALAGPDAGAARLVSDPALPVSLSPGQAVLARIRVVGGVCVPARSAGGSAATSSALTSGIPIGAALITDVAAAAQALSLEARIPWGFTQVTGFPTLAVQRALALHPGCGIAPRVHPPATP